MLCHKPFSINYAKNRYTCDLKPIVLVSDFFSEKWIFSTKKVVEKFNHLYIKSLILTY